MNLLHARSYEKLNAHFNKTQKPRCCNLFPNLKFFFSKFFSFVNESICLYSSGKRFQIFGPR